MEDALRARERELQAALQERERISQELHDGILQSLFGVGLNLEVTKSLMPQKTRKTAGGSLDKSIDQLNRVMREIRNFIAGLGPDLIEGKGLQTALQAMLTSLTENQAYTCAPRGRGACREGGIDGTVPPSFPCHSRSGE